MVSPETKLFSCFVISIDETSFQLNGPSCFISGGSLMNLFYFKTN